MKKWNDNNVSHSHNIYQMCNPEHRGITLAQHSSFAPLMRQRRMASRARLDVKLTVEVEDMFRIISQWYTKVDALRFKRQKSGIKRIKYIFKNKLLSCYHERIQQSAVYIMQIKYIASCVSSICSRQTDTDLIYTHNNCFREVSKSHCLSWLLHH